MAIERLLGEVPLAAFVEGHYLKLPFARAGGCAHLLGLGGWALAERLLASGEADARASRDGALWEGGRVASAAQARQLLADGYTFAVRHAERHDPALAGLAEGFRRDFLAPVDVHLYATPAGRPGLGWHYDAEDVFVLQLAGRKQWLLRKNTVNPWPLIETLPADMQHRREIMPVLRCTLTAGDWLYVPGGYWHRTEAGGEESVSLSVGLMPACAIEAFDFLRARLLGDLRWRQRLPAAGLAGGSPGERARAYREAFAELGRALAELLAGEETALAFLRERQARLAPAAGPERDLQPLQPGEGRPAWQTGETAVDDKKRDEQQPRPVPDGDIASGNRHDEATGGIDSSPLENVPSGERKAAAQEPQNAPVGG